MCSYSSYKHRCWHIIPYSWLSLYLYVYFKSELKSLYMVQIYEQIHGKYTTLTICAIYLHIKLFITSTDVNENTERLRKKES